MDFYHLQSSVHLYVTCTHVHYTIEKVFTYGNMPNNRTYEKNLYLFILFTCNIYLASELAVTVYSDLSIYFYVIRTHCQNQSDIIISTWFHFQPIQKRCMSVNLFRIISHTDSNAARGLIYRSLSGLMCHQRHHQWLYTDTR